MSEEAAAAGIELVLGMANAPTHEAAVRAGERFVSAGIDALIGGVGQGQAEALSRVAEEARIPFFNVSAADHELRHACRRFTFHVAPSAAMYLDAMVQWGASQGYQRWFIVHESTPEGETLAQRATQAISRFGEDVVAIDAASAARGEAFYGPQLDAAEAAGADTILLLLDFIDQVAFLGQQESLRVDIPVVPFPEATAQTRTYINSFSAIDLETSPDYRIAMWDASINDGEGGAFNERYISRFGAVADPQAWAAYSAVKILFEAVRGASSVEGDALADYLGTSGAQFAVMKGGGVSFRPWDHQLRQPLYVIRVDHDNEWVQATPTTHVGAAEVERTLPLISNSGGDPIAILDTLGDGPNDLACDF